MTPAPAAAGRGEAGSALIIALAVLAVVGLGVAGLLSYTDVGFTTTTVVREQRTDVYAADGAVEVAIETLDSDPGQLLGSDWLPCPDIVVPGLSSGDVVVECHPEPGSGGTFDPGESGGMPTRAVITLGTHPDEGFVQRSNDTLEITGGLFSHSRIAIQGSGDPERHRLEVWENRTLQVPGPVTARGPCPAELILAAPLDCDVAGPHPDGEDPRYPLTEPPGPVRTVPPCPGSERLVILQPGTYTSGAALSSLTTGNPCGKTFLWFTPGDYYFRFQDGNANNRVWRINDRHADVIGGTPLGWDPTGLVTGDPKPSIDPAVEVPGMICHPEEPGVRWIFGDDSRVRIDAGRVELCANPTESTPPIAVYGVPGTPQEAVLRASGAASSGDAVFADPEAATAIDGAWSETGELAAGPDDLAAELTLTGFSPGDLPAGAVITDVLLRLVHEEGGAAGAPETVVRPNGADPITLAPPACGAPCIWESDPLGITDPAELDGLEIDHTVTVPAGETGSAGIDGAELVVRYTMAGYEPQSGCVVAEPYTGGPGGGSNPPCAMLRADGNHTRVAVRGMVYAPSAALHVNLTNDNQTRFVSAAIARTIHAGVTPSSLFDGSAFGWADGEFIVAPRTVTFRARVAGNPQPTLVALVRFPEIAGTPKILNWDVQR